MPTAYLANILGHDAEALMALRELPAFKESSGALLELIFRYGKVVALAEGEELTREGDFDQWVYFIVKGRLGVYVGEEHVDTISSSLVGERCILGEHRRATLRATDAGVTALGVDMALLDALKGTAARIEEPVAVYIELLSIIAGEVVNRIAELEFNLIDFSYKYRAHRRVERLSDILRELAHNAYIEDRESNFAVYRYLLKHDPVVLSKCAWPDGYTVDTRHLYTEAVLEGRHDLLHRVAEAVLAEREQASAPSEEPAPELDGNASAATFAGFATHIAQVILAQREGHGWGEEGDPTLIADIRRRLSIGEDLRVDLRGLMHWLIAEHRYTAQDTIELLLTLMKESSNYTARLNARIRGMVHDLTQTRFGRELSSASGFSGVSVLEYYHNTPVDELIPFFSKNILDVYLVQPFLERLRAAQDGTWDRRASLSESLDESVGEGAEQAASALFK